MAKKTSKGKVAEVVEEQPTLEVKQDWMDDLQICLTFLTRIPIPGGLVISNPSVAQASRFFPIIGSLIGLVGVIVATIADILGLPFEVCILIALLSMILITGALHEDGFARTADAISRRVENKEQRLEIFRDSHVGVVGILALIFAVAVKWATLATFSLGWALVGLFLMAVISRGGLPIFMRYFALPAEGDQSKWLEQPEFDRSTVSAILALLVSFFTVGFWITIAIIIVLTIVTGLASWLATSLFGGKTIHALGALQQLSEICIILTIAVLGGD